MSNEEKDKKLPYDPTLKSPEYIFSFLGLNYSNANQYTDREIKKGYLKTMKKYHPDTISGKLEQLLLEEEIISDSTNPLTRNVLRNVSGIQIGSTCRPLSEQLRSKGFYTDNELDKQRIDELGLSLIEDSSLTSSYFELIETKEKRLEYKKKFQKNQNKKENHFKRKESQYKREVEQTHSQYDSQLMGLCQQFGLDYEAIKRKVTGEIDFSEFDDLNPVFDSDYLDFISNKQEEGTIDDSDFEFLSTKTKEEMDDSDFEFISGNKTDETMDDSDFEFIMSSVTEDYEPSTPEQTIITDSVLSPYTPQRKTYAPKPILGALPAPGQIHKGEEGHLEINFGSSNYNNIYQAIDKIKKKHNKKESDK